MAILWRDRAEGPRAAAALRITAKDCLEHAIADAVVEEPASGAHRDWDSTAERLDAVLDQHLGELRGLTPDQLEANRYDRFRKLGALA